jgi:hypothetical protein
VQLTQACGRIALGSLPSTGAGYFVDTATANLYPSPRTNVCPLLSPDGTRIAYAGSGGTADQGVAVQTLTDRGQSAPAPVAVGREGSPVAWSADSERILVQGNGTFLVRADVPGGTRTSLQLISGASVCRTPEHGMLIVFQQSAVYALDLERGRGTDLGGGFPGPTCSVSADERWVATGTTLIDLRRGASGDIRPSTARRASYQRLWFLARPAVVDVTRVTGR